MKNRIFGFAILGIVLLSMSFVYANYDKLPGAEKAADGIEWLSFEEAVKAQEKAPKKIVIDMYTSWCGWCKVMDRETFSDEAVIEYINENFYAVKFDAEQKESIDFQGKTYDYLEAGKRGVHSLAYSLMGGRASYPSFVFLDEDFKSLGVSRGFKKPDAFMVDLKKVNEYQPAN